MPLIDSPIPLSPLARSSSRAPPAPATIPATSDNDSDQPAPPPTGEPVTICDLDNPDTGTNTGTDTGTIGDKLPVEQHIEQPTADLDELERRAHELRAAVYSRLVRDGRWSRLNLGAVRDDMIANAKKRMSMIEAKIWTYQELDRLYQPRFTTDEGEADEGVSSTANGPGGDDSDEAEKPSCARNDSTDQIVSIEPSVTERVTSFQQNAPESSRLQGLGDVPADWLPLPANASLAAEIGWVQANRLYVVEERGNTTIVHLDRAHEPAPSRAAIGWLETSIRSYAKYVDVVGKCLGVESDESSVVRRERMAIAEIRSLLDEMHTD